MPTSETFQSQVTSLRGELVNQGRRCQELLELAFACAFERNADKAKKAIASDELIDKVDVFIERQSVAILREATAIGSRLEEIDLRWVLLIVKVNNEIERIADVGVVIAESAEQFANTGAAADMPATFRVLANSVVGIMRDATASLDKLDPALAKVVLLSEEAVLAFKCQLVREVQTKLAANQISIDLATVLIDIAAHCVSIADHCTNMAEQVMYTASGKIVRHMHGRWQEVNLPQEH